MIALLSVLSIYYTCTIDTKLSILECQKMQLEYIPCMATATYQLMPCRLQKVLLKTSELS
jgi:hypothetical protein